MPQRTVRTALIGVSGYARIHLRCLEELARTGRVALAAATVVNPEEEREAVERLRAGGCRVYSDYREMLESHRGALDLCCIPTGIPLHAPMTIAAVGAGANVLVEKPLAPSMVEVRAIRDAEASTRRWVAVGFQDLYLRENRELKRRLVAGAVGRIRRVSLRGLWPRDSSYYSRNDWAGRIRAGGQPVFDSPLSNAFSHFVNLALFFAGRAPDASAQPVAADGRLLRAQRIESFDTAAIRLSTVEGTEILLQVSHSSRSTLEPELLIEGEAGHATWQLEREIRIDGAGTHGSMLTLPLPSTEEARHAMFEQVVARVDDPSAFICGTAIAAEHTRAIECAQRLPIESVDPDTIDRFLPLCGEKLS